LRHRSEAEAPDLKNGATEPTEETELSVGDRFQVMLAPGRRPGWRWVVRSGENTGGWR